MGRISPEVLSFLLSSLLFRFDRLGHSAGVAATVHTLRGVPPVAFRDWYIGGCLVMARRASIYFAMFLSVLSLFRLLPV